MNDKIVHPVILFAENALIPARVLKGGHGIFEKAILAVPIDIRIKAALTQKGHMRHCAKGWIGHANGNIRRIGAKADASACGMKVEARNSLFKFQRNLIRHTAEGASIPRVMQAVDIKGLLNDVVSCHVGLGHRPFDFKIAVDLFNAHVSFSLSKLFRKTHCAFG